MAITLRHEYEELVPHDPKREIAEKIERAFRQFERGEFLSAEESHADMAKRKAVWLSEQSR
jgi:hypothetical protein